MCVTKSCGCLQWCCFPVTALGVLLTARGSCFSHSPQGHDALLQTHSITVKAFYYSSLLLPFASHMFLFFSPQRAFLILHQQAFLFFLWNWTLVFILNHKLNVTQVKHKVFFIDDATVGEWRICICYAVDTKYYEHINAKIKKYQFVSRVCGFPLGVSHVPSLPIVIHTEKIIFIISIFVFLVQLTDLN